MRSLLAERYSVSDFIAICGNDFPLLSKYSSTKQDSEWHSEGDVHIHTDMVLLEMYALLDDSELSISKMNVLILSALFHDYAKPVTTSNKEINGKIRVVAPNHESIGASILFTCTPPFNMEHNDWMQVIRLVEFHQIPKMLVVHEKRKEHYSKLYRNAGQLEMLYILEMADILGRHCADKDMQIHYLEMFKMFAIEYGCWNTDPYLEFKNLVYSSFPDSDANYVYHRGIYSYENNDIFMPEEEIARSFNYLGKQSHVIILCGLSASGKTSYTKKHLKGFDVINLDEIRRSLSKDPYNQKFSQESVRIATEKLKQSLRQNKNIVWDATNIRRDFRDRIFALASRYNAYVEIVIFSTTIKKSILSDNSRVESVGADVIRNQAERFQLPSYPEAHKLTYNQ